MEMEVTWVPGMEPKGGSPVCNETVLENVQEQTVVFLRTGEILLKVLKRGSSGNLRFSCSLGSFNKMLET